MQEKIMLPLILNTEDCAFEELDDLEEKFDVITSSLAFDYVENFERLMQTDL